MAESVIGLYKAECVRHEGPWRGVDDLELATLNWVWWSNEIRLQRALGRLTRRIRERPLPSDEHPAAAAVGRTESLLNPGRFSLPVGEEVGEGDRFVAVRAGGAVVDTGHEGVAVPTALFAELVFAAVGALVDREGPAGLAGGYHGRGWWRCRNAAWRQRSPQ